jgi:hypothetical protein
MTGAPLECKPAGGYANAVMRPFLMVIVLPTKEAVVTVVEMPALESED